MPSIAAGQLTQLAQSIPLAWGLPQRGQSGGMIRSSDWKQESQMKLPSLPQPTHHLGNSKSSATLLSLAA
jgi:hypothetical protein